VGKPYSIEMKALPQTFAWAKSSDISTFKRAVSTFATMPLVTIGSGGSHTAAALGAFFHERYTRQVALSTTPLQAAKMESLRNCGALIFSAGGRNPDALGVFKSVLKWEPRALAILCLEKSSPLGRLCSGYESVSFSEFSLPSGKDGFVATNSLVAFATILWRAFTELCGNANETLISFEDAATSGSRLKSWSEELREGTRVLWEKRYLLVLHGSGPSYPAALDLESKFNEAAIGAVQIADYRNFAHGRHHWLDKYRDDTAVLALITNEEVRHIERTLSLLPASIPAKTIVFAGTDGRVALSALVTALHLAGFAAEARGIDPGRPGVAEFGRRIYNLNIWPKLELDRTNARARVAIERKVGVPLSSISAEENEQWRNAYHNFLTSLHATLFRALILDYDGTLCDDRFRFGSLPENVGQLLNKFLVQRIALGVATGRGKSVRKALRDCLDPSLWPSVYVAYHNGSEIGTLDDDQSPAGVQNVREELAKVATNLAGSVRITAIAKIEQKASQISIVADKPSDTAQLYRLVCDIVSGEFASGISCVRSSHSVDVLAPGVSKERLIRELQTRLGCDSESFLSIGDLGSWPGNDFSLLTASHSLSVNEVSSRPDRCWNIAPLGFRNSQATRFLLGSILPSNGSFRFRLAEDNQRRTLD